MTTEEEEHNRDEVNMPMLSDTDELPDIPPVPADSDSDRSSPLPRFDVGLVETAYFSSDDADDDDDNANEGVDGTPIR